MSHGRFLLIIDDDPDDQDLFVEAVQEIDKSIRCETLSNGEEAIEFLENSVLLPDYVFLDLNMPRLGGRQCLEQMRTNSKLQDLIVTVYTTSSRHEDIREMKNLGATYYLTKPSRFDQLKEAIRCVLEMDKDCVDITGLKVLI